MSQKIFIALSTFGQYGNRPIELLKKSGMPFDVNPSGKRLNQEEIIRLGKDFEGIIAGLEPYDEFVLDQLPKLKCISRCGVGIDNIALKKSEQKGIRILNTPDVVVQPVAELTIGMIFDLLRKLSVHAKLMQEKRWERKAGYLLQGKTAGILGTGRIGRRVAEMLASLGARVIAVDLYPDPKWAKQFKVEFVSLENFLEISDIVSIHLSSLAGKPFQLGDEELAKMKKGSFLVNVARGQFVDEDALYHSLSSGHLGGAALDVFQKEPYTGKLCELSNVVLTPHLASLTQESRLQMEVEATQNIINFFKDG